ncbi:S41 family peptidase [Emticicia sp. 17c]|uniref:S41 family peptidase n=1 Tax=Emticicia sp. 17c TaxID=3127704 RepID=UPI00301BBC9C
MKKLLLVCFVFCCFKAYPQKQTFSVEEIRQDMAVLKRKFEKLHSGMYYYTTQKHYERFYDSLYNSIQAPVSYLEAYRLLAQLVTEVKDGHTGIRFNKKRFNTKKLKLVPFYLRKIDNKYYISLNTSADSTIIRGSEVLLINNEPIAPLLEKLKAFVSSDNGNEEAKYYYATGAFPNYYLRQYGEKDSIIITYKLPRNDSVFSKKVACLTSKEINKISDKRYKTFNRPNLGLKVIDSLNHIALLNITEFSMAGKFFDPTQIKFKRTLKKRFKQIKAQGIEHLVLDFRGNGGGYVPNISRVLKYLSPTPFTIIDTMGFKRKAYFTIAKPYHISPPLVLWMAFSKRKGDFMYRVNRKNNNQKPVKKWDYRGKTYFLTDPGCYSATTFTLNIAKDLGIGQAFIGQPVGGASWGSFAGTWQDFKLPNTKYIIHTPLYKIVHRLPNKVNNGFFLDLDYEVNRNYEELLKNNTSVIDFTVDMIRASKAAHSR